MAQMSVLTNWFFASSGAVNPFGQCQWMLKFKVWSLFTILLFNGIVDVCLTENFPSKPDGSTAQSTFQQEKTVNVTIDCEDLLPGQYYCENPDVDLKTQQPVNCSREKRSAPVPCYPVQGVRCSGQEHTGLTVGFYRHVPCKWTNGHSFSVALLLSVFLGMFGVDRFYLGYPAIGLLKLCTLGFMFLGQLIDILLIALQVVGPSDNSDYVIDYFGPGLMYIGQDNFTYIQPHYEH